MYSHRSTHGQTPLAPGHRGLRTPHGRLARRPERPRSRYRRSAWIERVSGSASEELSWARRRLAGRNAPGNAGDCRLRPARQLARAGGAAVLAAQSLEMVAALARLADPDPVCSGRRGLARGAPARLRPGRRGRHARRLDQWLARDALSSARWDGDLGRLPVPRTRVDRWFWPAAVGPPP